MDHKTVRPTLSRVAVLAASILGLTGLWSPPATAAPSNTLLFSADGGSTWSKDVTAYPGSMVIARIWYNNDASDSIANTSVKTVLPTGFTLVPNSTVTCLSPSTSNPALPGIEKVCSTDAGQGGVVNDTAVWSGSNLTVSPTAGLFGQSTSDTSGTLAMGKTRYVNLQQCVYSSTNDNFTTLMPGGNPAFGGDTNTSNTADTAPNCQPGTATVVPNVKNTRVLPLDLLGQRYVNLQQCVYTSTENFTTLMPGGNPAFGGDTNTSNTADTAPNCQPGTATDVPNVNNT
ncbi:hypothetical protein OV450_8445, partial [Actinobacteria bacterium OV450]